MLRSLLLFVFIFLVIDSFSQSCLYEGITFSTQSQIDSFPLNYPSCDSIIGNLAIIGGQGITNLDSLIQLNGIGSELRILYFESNLFTLSGLDSLRSVGGLLIQDCDSLNDLAALNNLKFIGASGDNPGYITIRNCGNLDTLIGFDSLQTLNGFELTANFNGYIYIENNQSLKSISGFNSLDDVFLLKVYNNPSLSTFSGFNNSSEILQLEISYNDSLLDVSGFNQLTFIASLELNENNYLNQISFPFVDSIYSLDIENCNRINLESGLDNLSFIGNRLKLRRLDSLVSIATFNNLIFCKDLSIIECQSLQVIDGFSNLTSIQEDLRLSTLASLHSLAGFSSLEVISNGLGIYKVDSLTDLDELSSLDHINNRISISSNAILENIDALSNVDLANGNGVSISIVNNTMLQNINGLSGIGGLLGSLIINGNAVLNNLDSLNGVENVWRRLEIQNNDSLTNIDGLSNVNGNSIEGPDVYITTNSILSSIEGIANMNISDNGYLRIHDNPNLSICSVESICDYLQLEDAHSIIYDNNSGCNSVEEVELACFTGISKNTLNNFFSIYPNPAINELYIEKFSNEIFNEIQIFDQLGRRVLTLDYASSIDLSRLAKGLYLLKIISDHSYFVERFYKM